VTFGPRWLRPSANSCSGRRSSISRPRTSRRFSQLPLRERGWSRTAALHYMSELGDAAPDVLPDLIELTTDDRTALEARQAIFRAHPSRSQLRQHVLAGSIRPMGLTFGASPNCLTTCALEICSRSWLSAPVSRMIRTPERSRRTSGGELAHLLADYPHSCSGWRRPAAARVGAPPKRRMPRGERPGPAPARDACGARP